MKKLLLIMIIWGFSGVLGYASPVEVSPERLADAIFHAENSKTHPYGILAHYKHTTPRQACLNTIKHALKDWNGKGDFIVFLGSRYCPPKAHPLNKNWVRLVKFFLTKNVKNLKFFLRKGKKGGEK